jgi:hypothetical protein
MMQLIEHYEVPSGGVSSITFSSIPATFTDLHLMLSLRSDRDRITDDLLCALNSGGTYSSRFLFGSGSTVSSSSITNAYAGSYPGNDATANTFGNKQIYIPNYSATGNKMYSADTVTENNGTEARQMIVVTSWSETSPITTITITSLNSTNFLEYSSATLYGILAGSDGIVAVS